MRLLHLTAVSSTRPPASLEFAPRLTAIYGASEAGKSYVVEAIDFVLGARTLREVPEARDYDIMLLGMELNDHSLVTLGRSLRGGPVSVYDEDLRIYPPRSAPRSLRGEYHRTDTANISSFMLEELGIAGSKVRMNQRNKLQAASFRQVAHLVLIDEEQMQSRISPIETGQYVSRTAERSTFKLLVEGRDDSDLVEGEDAASFRRLNTAQLEVLDRAMSSFSGQLEKVPELPECLEVLARVNGAISASTASISDVVSRRERLLERRRAVYQERHEAAVRESEATALLNRFTLLEQQYSADLGRLQLVQEAGTLLGYFDTGSCVFCGASTEHQQREHAVYETEQLAESVQAERVKTRALQSDLAATLAEIRSDILVTQSRVVTLGESLRVTQAELLSIEADLAPAQENITTLLARRSEVERWIELWKQMASLETLRSTVMQEEPITAEAVKPGVTLGTQQDFNIKLRTILEEWKVPGAPDATLSFEKDPTIFMQGRRREDRGKGMRSILHAGFSIALSEYCAERQMPHPGFVALDTPVLTYRDAEGLDDGLRADTDAEELLSASVADSFYNYLSTKHPGQTIVLENQTPPELTAANCHVVYFTGNPETGRAGFYPVTE